MRNKIMFKLNSSLYTKNYLGLSDEDLARCEIDPYYHYLRVHTPFFELEKKGHILTIIEHINLNIRKDCVVLVKPNPKLFELGLISYSPILTGSDQISITIQAFKAAEVELDYLVELRLMD
jgi:hypothetical protein